MANVNYWSASWVAGEYGLLDDLYPDEVHSWVMWGFNIGDVLNVVAYPVVGDPTAGERILEVENARVEGDPSGYRFYFSIRNTGNSSIPGYSLNYSGISN
jgi:hypothetical protein